MKKITLILAFIGMISLTSCTVEETHVSDNGYDSDTISEVWEYTNVDFYYGNNYSVFLDFPHQTYSSDMVLVYHLYDIVNGTDVWRLMPQTYYLNGGGELDYNFDFTTYDANVFLGANFDLNTLDSSWTQNQIFRVVVIPGYFGNKVAASVDFNDYDAVIKHYNIDEKKIIQVK
ncbi:MAG: hypothetical protein KYX68_09220 [Flavobacterium sp.]|nr:hypothetical protein [Flavobacterium sp.]